MKDTQLAKSHRRSVNGEAEGEVKKGHQVTQVLKYLPELESGPEMWQCCELWLSKWQVRLKLFS